MKFKKSEQERLEAIKSLKRFVRKGATVYTSCDHVSQSGMTRHIAIFCVYKREIIRLTWYVSKLCGYTMAKDGCLIVHGCGMDMGYDVVYSLSYALFKGSKVKDPGYILKHQWL